MKHGINDPCPCESQKKYKKCCELKQASKKIEATILHSGASQVAQTNQLSSMFFKNVLKTEPQSLDKKDIKKGSP